MPEVKHIKNPLTVIVFFAGLSEVFGTLILPHLNKNAQNIFIWFIMGFPILLVFLFFYTLHKNYKVLYAPSDYKDESNFLALLKTTSKESELKIEEELKEEESSFNQTSVSKTITVNEINDFRTKLQLAEDLSFKKIENDMNLKILTDNKFVFDDRTSYMPDGVVVNDYNILVFEVKYTKKRTFLKSTLENIFEKISKVSNVVNDRPIIFHFIIVHDNNEFSINHLDQTINEIIREKEIKFGFQLHVFSLENLKK